MAQRSVLSHCLVLLFLMAAATPVTAQRGYKVINKAEKHYAEGNNKKALRFLKRAEKKNLGSCGLGWFAGKQAIERLRAKIYLDQHNYAEVRRVLGPGCYNAGPLADSLLIRSYQLEFGKDSLRNMIEPALENVQLTYKEGYPNSVIIPLINGSNLQLGLPTFLPDEVWILGSEAEKRKHWIREFRESKSYALLLEHS